MPNVKGDIFAQLVKAIKMILIAHTYAAGQQTLLPRFAQQSPIFNPFKFLVLIKALMKGGCFLVLKLHFFSANQKITGS